MAENPYMLTPEEQLAYAGTDPAHPYIDTRVVTKPVEFALNPQKYGYRNLLEAGVDAAGQVAPYILYNMSPGGVPVTAARNMASDWQNPYMPNWQKVVNSAADLLGVTMMAAPTQIGRMGARAFDYIDDAVKNPYVMSPLRNEVGAITWHGTPHRWAAEERFPAGRPRLDRVGSGEGAAAYGHGWYSADAEDVGDFYRKNLTDWSLEYKNTLINGVKKPKFSDLAPNEQTALERIANDVFTTPQKQTSIATLRDKYQKQIEWMSKADRSKFTDPKTSELLDKQLGNYQDRIRFIDSHADDLDIAQGALYKLDIPDEVMPTLLDWDKPLSEQSEQVKNILQTNLSKNSVVDAQFAGDRIVASNGGTLNGDPSGKQIYKFFANKYGDKAASEYMTSIGIPGNKYLDYGSRGAQEGSYNYVVWDQNVLDRTVPLAINKKPTGFAPGDYPYIKDAPPNPYQANTLAPVLSGSEE